MAGNQYLMSTPTQLHLAAARLADGTSTVSMGWFLFLVDLFTRRPDGCDGLSCLPADGTALWYVDGDHSLHDGYIEPTCVRLTRDGAGGRITSLTVPGCGTIDFEYDGDGDETRIPSAASGFDTASCTPDLSPDAAVCDAMWWEPMECPPCPSCLSVEPRRLLFGSMPEPSPAPSEDDQYVLNHEDAQPSRGCRRAASRDDTGGRPEPRLDLRHRALPRLREVPGAAGGARRRRAASPEPTCEEPTALQPSSCAKKCKNEKKCKKFASTKCGACPARAACRRARRCAGTSGRRRRHARRKKCRRRTKLGRSAGRSAQDLRGVPGRSGSLRERAASIRVSAPISRRRRRCCRPGERPARLGGHSERPAGRRKARPMTRSRTFSGRQCVSALRYILR